MMTDTDEGHDGSSFLSYSLPTSPIKANFRHRFSSMSQEEQAEQLAVVQEMVQEMKDGFVTVMEELAKIKYGDQNLQQEVASNKEASDQQMQQLTTLVQSLKSQVDSVCLKQKELEDRMVAIGRENREVPRLGLNGVIQQSPRQKLPHTATHATHTNDFDSGVNLHHNGGGSSEGDITPPKMAPMVKPFMDSLSCSKDNKDEADGYSTDSSVTAAANKSLRLTHTLRDKYMDANIADQNNRNDSSEGSEHDHVSGDEDPDSRGSGRTHLPNQKERIELIGELVASERQYCTKLWSIVDHFIHPLQQTTLVSARDINAIFPPYLTQMYDHHCMLLHGLNDRIHGNKHVTVVGDIFATLTDTQENDLLTLYRDYVSDFPSVLANLTKWSVQSAKFKTFLKRCSSNCNSDLTPLLLAPIERIPQYVLLIKRLLKLTDHGHSDRHDLISSLAVLRNFLNQLNDDIQHSLQLVENSTKNRSGTSIKSSGSSDVPNLLSARDSGVHSTVNDELPKPRARHPRQLLAKRIANEHVTFPNRRRMATSQPDISHGMSPTLGHLSPYDDIWQTNDRHHRHSAIPNSYMDPRRAIASSYNVPNLDLDEYYDEFAEVMPSYRSGVVRVRPVSVTGSRINDYDKGRVTRLLQNRPRSSAAERAYADRFRNDAESQLQDMIDSVHSDYPQHVHDRYIDHTGGHPVRLCLSHEDEYYNTASRSRHRHDRVNQRKLPRACTSGCTADGMKIHNATAKNGLSNRTPDYGVYGEKDDVDNSGFYDVDNMGDPGMGVSSGVEEKKITNVTNDKQSMIDKESSGDEKRHTSSEMHDLSVGDLLNDSKSPKGNVTADSSGDNGTVETGSKRGEMAGDRGVAVTGQGITSSPCIIDCGSESMTSGDPVNHMPGDSVVSATKVTASKPVNCDGKSRMSSSQGRVSRPRKQLPHVFSTPNIKPIRPEKPPLKVRPVSQIHDCKTPLSPDRFNDKQHMSSAENIFQATLETIATRKSESDVQTKYTIGKPLVATTAAVDNNVRKRLKEKEIGSSALSKSAEDITKASKKKAGLRESIKSMFYKGKKQVPRDCDCPPSVTEMEHGEKTSVMNESDHPHLSLPHEGAHGGASMHRRNIGIGHVTSVSTDVTEV